MKKLGVEVHNVMHTKIKKPRFYEAFLFMVYQAIIYLR